MQGRAAATACRAGGGGGVARISELFPQLDDLLVHAARGLGVLLALGTQLRRMPLLDGAHLLLRRLLLRVDSLCAQRSSEARSMEASSECSRLAVRAFYRVSIPRAPPRSHKVRPSLRAACAPSLAPGESRCTSSAACATHCVRLAACNATALVPPARDQRESLLLLVQGHLLR